MNTNFIYVNVVSADSPSTDGEAVNSNDNDSWKKAVNLGMNSLDKNKTWKLVEKPKDKKVLDVFIITRVFTNKSDGRKKSRLVVRVF